MNRRQMADEARPWGGLIGGFAGLALAHQVGSDATFNNCTTGSPGIVILVILLGLALIGGGSLFSWRVFRRDAEGPARKFIAILSLGCAALFALAILPLISALVIPRCWS